MEKTKKGTKGKWRLFLESRFLLGVLMLSIGVGYSVSYYEGQELFRDYREALRIFEEVKKGREVGLVGSPAKHASDEQPASAEGEGEMAQGQSTSPVVQSPEEITKALFGEDSNVAVAVFMSESGLRADAKNYNCLYDGKSRACEKGDKEKAWSVDCGVAQINHIGKECPAELFDPQKNIELAKEMFDKRGFSPWVNYKNEKYLAFL